jgi:cytochrome c oxidase subunit 1
MTDDPWGYGRSLEWATSCPPPRHNFLAIPPIRSNRPAFEAHYPQYRQRLHEEAFSSAFGKRHLQSAFSGGRRQGDHDPDPS